MAGDEDPLAFWNLLQSQHRAEADELTHAADGVGENGNGNGNGNGAGNGAGNNRRNRGGGRK